MILPEYQQNPFLFYVRLMNYFDRIEIYKKGSFINRHGEIVPYDRSWIKTNPDERVYELLEEPIKEVKLPKEKPAKTFKKDNTDFKRVLNKEVSIGDVIYIQKKWRQIADIVIDDDLYGQQFKFIFTDGTSRYSRFKASWRFTIKVK
jgi:hypothetical protein